MNARLALLRLRLRALLSPFTATRSIDEELRLHLEMHEEELVASGVPPGEARRRARAELGDLEGIRSRLREISLLPGPGRSRKGPGDMIRLDFRYALRSLAHRPGFALIAILTLSLGIAATTAIYSLVDGIVLRPLRYEDSDRLVVLSSTILARNDTISVDYPEILEWRKQEDLFESVAAATMGTQHLTGEFEPEQIRTLQTSPELFEMFRARAIAGRLLTPSDYRDDGYQVAVLSRALWERVYGADPAIVGRDIRIDDRPYRVVGVVDGRDLYPDGVDLWMPLYFGDAVPGEGFLRWDNFFLRSAARLREGVTVQDASTRVRDIAARLATEMPSVRGGYGAVAQPLQTWIVGPEVRTALWVLLATVGLVLVIACVNVANMLLARAAERDREVALRRALGASRGDLLRQHMAESLILCLAGGTGGVLLATVLTSVIVATLPAGVPRIDEVSVDTMALAFAAGVSLLTAFVFGLVPVARGAGADPAEALGDASRSSTGGVRTRRIRSALVVAQVTFSLVLLALAGLMLRSVDALMGRSPGVNLDGALAVQVSLPSARYPTGEAADRFFRDLSEQIDRIPGVRSTAAATSMPMVRGGLWRVHLEEGAPEPPDGPEYQAQWNVVSPGFFRTAEIPVLSGRAFEETDREDTEPVIVVSDSFARQMFPAGDAIGKRIRSWRDENLYRTIVGIVGDVRMGGMDADIRNVVYVSTEQTPERYLSPRAFLIRTEGDPTAIASAVREAIHAQDPLLPIGQMATLRELAASSLDRIWVVGRLLAIFAALALGLAATGLYGLTAYTVSQRSREYGIRLALGARGADVVRGVVGGALRLAAIGLGIGLLASLALGRLVTRVLLHMPGTDVVTYVVVVAILLLVTLAAALVPARRAMRVDPIASLRAD